MNETPITFQARESTTLPPETLRFNSVDNDLKSTLIFTIHRGGRIVVANGKTLDDAAICFWAAVAKYCPPQCSVEVHP